MIHGYTPGLTVSPLVRLARRRVLPLRGEVLVSVREPVSPDTVVARAELPGGVHAHNVAAELGLSPHELPASMLKREGDHVGRGEPVAEQRGLFGLFRSRSLAPVSGTIETVSAVTGQVLYREPPAAVEVLAYLRGRVSAVLPGEGAIVESEGAFVQGIFGVGGEAHGPIVVAAGGPEAVLEAEDLSPRCTGAVVVGGSLATLDAVREASRLGVRGIVVGGIHDDDLRALIGSDLGVAITGQEDLGPTLIATEGFGRIAMGRRIYDLLARDEGREASINGTTQIRAGVIRPEVIVPRPEGGEAVEASGSPGLVLAPGSTVRLIREPRFGEIGRVEALPSKPVALETEAEARGVVVRLRDGDLITVPRANVELIEE